MNEFAIVVVAAIPAIGIASGLFLVWKHWASKRQLRAAETFDQCWCGFQTDRDTVHRIFEVQDNSDLVERTTEGRTRFRPQRGEGTAVSADLCAEHCTGNCNRGCPPREVELPWKKLEI